MHSGGMETADEARCSAKTMDCGMDVDDPDGILHPNDRMLKIIMTMFPPAFKRPTNKQQAEHAPPSRTAGDALED